MATFGDVLSNQTWSASSILRRKADDSGYESVPFGKRITLANGASARLTDVGGAYAGTSGLAFIMCEGDFHPALFALCGPNVTTYEMSDPASRYSTVAGTASSTNIYHTTPSGSDYAIQNNLGASRIYLVYLFVDW